MVFVKSTNLRKMLLCSKWHVASQQTQNVFDIIRKSIEKVVRKRLNVRLYKVYIKAIKSFLYIKKHFMITYCKYSNILLFKCSNIWQKMFVNNIFTITFLKHLTNIFVVCFHTKHFQTFSWRLYNPSTRHIKRFYENQKPKI